MKNLKKVLALVLVVAMMASFAVTAGAANFTDKSSVKNTEAVEVMSTIGIIDGYADGSFKPEGTLTREQAAKIITYMKLGKTAADKLVATVAPYSDVAANRWSAGAIAYCTNEGILAGVGNGKFNPTGELTGLQFAKMLLVALGYDPKIEGLTGSAWAVNTATLALDADLDDDVDSALSTAISRQNAAQMAFNTLKADLVEYDTTTNVNVNGAVVSVGNSKAKVVTTDKSWGKNVKNEKKDNKDVKEYTVQFAEKYLQDLKGSDEDDAFGRDATKWTWKNDEIGTYSDEADYTYTAKVSKKALYNDLGKSVYDDLTASKDPTTLNVWVDGKNVVKDSTDSANVAKYLDKNSTQKLDNQYTGNGTLTEVYVGDNNNVNIVIINTYVVQATENYNSKKEEVAVEFPENATEIDLNNGEEKLSADDFDVENVKEDDYLLITVADGKIKTVAPAKTVTGKVSSYSVGNDVTIDGTLYKYTNNISTDKDNGKNVPFSKGDEATVVLDAYGYIIYVDEANATSGKYVFLLKANNKGDFDDDVIADAFFVDGTRKTITVKNDDVYTATKINDNMTAGHGWYTYTEKSNGKYELKAVAVADQAKVTAEAKKNLTTNGSSKIGTYRANSSTVFVVLDDDEVKLYTGIKNVPTIAATDKSGTLTAYVSLDKNSYAEYVFIDDIKNANVSKTGSTSKDYVYVLKQDRTGTDENDNDYIQFKAIVNGETTTIRTKDTKEFEVGKLYKDIVYDKDTNLVSGFSEVKDNNDDQKADKLTEAEIDYKSGVLTLDAKTDLTLADKYNIYLWVDKGVEGINDNDDDYDVSTVTGSSLKTTCKGYKVTGDYVALLDDDGYATAIYVHVTDATEVPKA